MHIDICLGHDLTHVPFDAVVYNEYTLITV